MNGSLLLLLGLSALMAPSVPVNTLTDLQPAKVSLYESGPDELMKMNSRKSPATVSEGGVTVTVNLVYGDGEYWAKNFYIYNEDTFMGGSVSMYDPEGRCIVLKDMAPGTYTLMGAFDEMISHPGTPWTKCYVFLEDVVIDGDTEVNIDASTAVNQFKGLTYLPDGEIARVDNNGYDENLEPAFIPGNCLDKLIQTTIYDTKYDAWIVSAVGNTGSYAMDNIYGPGIHWRPEEMYDIMVNNISDRFVVCQQRDNYTENGMVASVAYSRGISNLDLSNDISNYRSVEEFFAHTPAFEAYGAPDEHYQFTGLGYEGWSYFPYTILPWRMNCPFTAFYSTSRNASEFDNLHPYFRFQLYDAMVDWEEFYLKGQRFTFDDEGAVYLFSNFYAPSEVSGTRAVDAEGNEVYYEFPGHPGLQVNGSPFIDYIYGNCAPVNTVSPVIYKDGDRFYTNINPVFKGLLGEEREADKVGLKVSASHDGVEGDAEGDKWNRYWNQAPNENPDGVYVAHMENSSNILVSGWLGYNITTLEFSYQRKDVCPPTLQAVQFRNPDNLFAQTFTSTDEVRINLCAGDYDWQDTPDYLEYNYASKPVTVKVEVAPTNVEPQNWTVVEVRNREEYNNLAGYGYYFEGSLAGVELPQTEGWFDLRITVTDEAGNVNRQEFGPAFLIDSSSNIATPAIQPGQGKLAVADGRVSTADGSEADFTVFGVDGRRVAGCHGATMDLGDLTPGIYIVSAHSNGWQSSVKAVVR